MQLLGAPQYEVLDVIGKGTTGSVLKVSRSGDAGTFVVKQVPLSGFSDHQRQEMLNEAQVMSHVLHPNIVCYEDSFVHNDTLHIVMEYAGGGDLGRRIRARNDPLEEEEIWRVLIDIAQGLLHLHEARILHGARACAGTRAESSTADASLWRCDSGSDEG